MKTKCRAAFSILLALGFALPLPFVRADPSTRAGFAEAMGSVTANMKAADVVKLLGKPDDIVTQFDPGGMDADKGEIWCYGTDGHLTYPTLGRVYLVDGVVQSTKGGNGTPPDPAMFDEAMLRKLLRLLASCCNAGTNPRLYIQVVNALIPLGKEKALAVIAEYDRVGSEGGAGINSHFVIMRLLFEVPPQSRFATGMLGPTGPDEPQDPKVVPLYPLALVDDIPLDLVSDYAFPAGNRFRPDYVKYFRENGTIRQHPLVPGNDPLSALATLGNSPQWIYRYKFKDPASANDKSYVSHQLLQLINTVYHVKPVPEPDGEPDPADWLPNDDTFDKHWDEVVKEVAALHIKWDPAKEMYVFANGTTLPEIKRTIYMKRIWYIPAISADSKLVVVRTGKDDIYIDLDYKEYPGVIVPESDVRVYRAKARGPALAGFHVEGSHGEKNEAGSDDRVAKLPEGESVRVEVIAGGKSVASGTLTP